MALDFQLVSGSDQSRICLKCGLVKPNDAFTRQARGLNGRKSRCKACAVAENRRYSDQNPGARHRSRRKHVLKKAYGLTELAYAQMIATQEGRCAICGSLNAGLTRFGKPKAWTVDHNHATGAVRGLLCSSCNMSLGLLKDDPQNLLLALRYLVKHGAPDPLEAA